MLASIRQQQHWKNEARKLQKNDFQFLNIFAILRTAPSPSSNLNVIFRFLSDCGILLFIPSPCHNKTVLFLF